MRKLIIITFFSVLSWLSVFATDFPVTNNADAGAGSLRQAIIDANTAGGIVQHTITPTGVLTITLLSALPDVDCNLKINGSVSDSIVVNAFAGSTIIKTINNKSLELNYVKLKGAVSGATNGGALNITGATTLNNCTLISNKANYGAGVYISAGGSLTCESCTINSNQNSSSVYTEGGVIFSDKRTTVILNSCEIKNNTGKRPIIDIKYATDAAAKGGISTLTITNSVISNNVLSITTSPSPNQVSGGGVSAAAVVTITNSEISNNSAPRGGGLALQVGTSTYKSKLTMNKCLVSNNTATGRDGNANGGGIYIAGSTANVTDNCEINNTTISGNICVKDATATSSFGGGLQIGSGGGTSFITNCTLNNCTVVSNTTGGTSTVLYRGGGVDVSYGNLILNYCIVANNNSSSTAVERDIYKAATNSTIGSATGRNLFGGTVAFTTPGMTETTGNINIANGTNMATIFNTTLADNGGSTTLPGGGYVKTHALVAGCAATNPSVAGSGLQTTDQRGIVRSTPDMGAYEYVTYRSKGSGNWGSTSSWQSGDNSTWSDVTVIPTLNVAGSITVQNTHEITVAANATSPALTINSGGKLTLNSGYTLGVTGNFTIQSDGTNGTGTFVDKSTNGLTVSGTSTVNQNLSSPLRSWYMSSPVTGAQPTGMDRIKYYDEATNLWPTLYNSALTSGQPSVLYGENSFTTGKGYLVVPVTGNSIAFTGALNTGEKSITLLKTDGATKTGFNLIGNPYPSYLDWTAVFANTANAANLVDGTMWYRTKVETLTPGVYEYKFWTVNGDGEGSVTEATKYIAPMQAFWVRAKTIGSELLTLNNDMRSHGEATNKLLKAPKAKNSVNPLVRLQVSNGANTDEAVIYFSANASNERDVYDAPKMSNENAAIPEIYTTLGTEQMVINGMNSIPLDQEIGLGFVAGDATSFSLKSNEVSNLPADVKLILKDNLTNAETDVTDGVNAYAFTPLATSGNRFSVIFRSTGAVTGLNIQDDNLLLAYTTQKNQITLVNNDMTNVGSTASVYNAVGQKLMSKQLSGSITLLNGNFKPGVYVVKVNNLSKKVIIK